MAANRAAYLNQQREDKAAYNLVGAGYEAAKAKQESEISKEQLENEMTLMKGDTSNYDVDTMQSQLDSLLVRDNLSENEELRSKALMKKLATKGGYAQGLLAKSVGQNNVATNNRQLVSKFMSGDDDVASAIAKKDSYTAQYLRDINNGDVDTSAGLVNSNMNLATWMAATRSGAGVANQKFVNDKVLTDDSDFVSQSTGIVTANLPTMTNDRLARILGNERVMQSADGEVQDALRNEAANRNAAVPGSVTPVLSAAQSAQLQQQSSDQTARQQQHADSIKIHHDQLSASHEQAALARGTESIQIGNPIAGGRVTTGYAPPSNAGFDLSNPLRVNTVTSVDPASGVMSTEEVITSNDGTKKWNITRARYENP